jgi:hypothetical protein
MIRNTVTRIVALLCLAGTATAQTGTLELDLVNIDRLLYVIAVDGAVREKVEGYVYIPNASWERQEKKAPKTVAIADLPAGKHTITVEVQQDPNTQQAQSREEYLRVYQPLTFEIDIKPGTIHKTVDLAGTLSGEVAVFHRMAYDKKSRWVAHVDTVGGHTVEVKIRQYTKGGDIGPRARNRIYAKGQYKSDKKRVFFAEGQALVDGHTVYSFKDIPCGGEVEYEYWDYRQGIWISESFPDHTLSDAQPIVPYVQTVPVGETHELRIGAFGSSMGYSIVLVKGAAPAQAADARPEEPEPPSSAPEAPAPAQTPETP